MPTWAKVAGGFFVSVLGYIACGAYVYFAAAQAGAEQRADPDPGPDSAAAYTGLFYIMLSPCILAAFLITGAVLCVSRRRRPFGVGMVGGVIVPLLIVVVFLRVMAYGSPAPVGR
ncbi:hypothetical protein OG470_19725 [Micromonospora sp. NBC_00389]|uniref:hypothetical protein n=1 Tax=Micromonospora sp. NBC_00389 TaxID=2903586 RepID=UPI002E1F73A3